MQFLQDSDIDIESWQSLLKNNDFANPFQSFEFYAFFNSMPDYSARVFAVSDKDELLALCVVTFQKQKGLAGYFSRLPIIYGGPLIISNINGLTALALLLKGINDRICHKAIYAETYNFFDYSIFKDTFAICGWQYDKHLNVQIDVRNKSLEEVLASMNYNRRREITMSLKAGAIIREAHNIEEVLELYNILADLYKQRVLLPLPPFPFFKQFFLSKTGVTFIVIHNDKVIGGSFCLYVAARAVFTYYYCGLRDYQKNIFPSQLAIFAAIEFAIKNNLNYVDLMGAGKPEKEYGVRDFKLRFGGVLLEQGRFLKAYNPVLFNLGKTGLKIVKWLKR